jgi:signal transduction histidine kinase
LAATSDLELTKVFKFYYTDPAGNPDLSLATARLVIETYGGELNATQERDKVTFRFSLPLGDQ